MRTGLKIAASFLQHILLNKNVRDCWRVGEHCLGVVWCSGWEYAVAKGDVKYSASRCPEIIFQVECRVDDS